MEIQLAFDPHLGVNPADFASQWQQTPENRAIAQISLAKSPAKTFSDPDTALAILTGILLGVPSNAIWDAIKLTYHRLCASHNQQPQPIEFQQIKTPDGTEITIVRWKP